MCIASTVCNTSPQAQGHSSGFQNKIQNEEARMEITFTRFKSFKAGVFRSKLSEIRRVITRKKCKCY